MLYNLDDLSLPSALRRLMYTYVMFSIVQFSLEIFTVPLCPIFAKSKGAMVSLQSFTRLERFHGGSLKELPIWRCLHHTKIYALFRTA